MLDRSKLVEAAFYSHETPGLMADVLNTMQTDMADALNTVQTDISAILPLFAGVLSSIAITGDSTLQLGATDPVSTAEPTATLKNPLGDTITGSTVVWSLKTPITGVSVNSSTGVLTATAAVAAPVTATIVAAVGTVKAEKTVAITAAA
jgi:hypothetical protein